MDGFLREACRIFLSLSHLMRNPGMNFIPKSLLHLQKLQVLGS